MLFKNFKLNILLVLFSVMIYASCTKEDGQVESEFTYDDFTSEEVETRSGSNLPISQIPGFVKSDIAAEYPDFVIKKAKVKYNLETSYEINLYKTSTKAEVELKYNQDWEQIVSKMKERLTSTTIPVEAKALYPGFTVYKAERKITNGTTVNKIEFKKGSLKKEVYFDETWDVLIEKVKGPEYYVPVTSVPTEVIDNLGIEYPEFNVTKVKSKTSTSGAYYEVKLTYGFSDISIEVLMDSDWNVITIGG